MLQDFASRFEILPTSSLNQTQYKQLEDLLVEGFKEGPFMKCVDPTSFRESTTRWLFSRRLVLFKEYSYSLVEKSTGHVLGHAALSPSNAQGMSPSFWTKLNLGFFWSPLSIGFGAASRLQEGLSLFRKSDEEKEMSTLEAVVVSKSLRGQGIGHELMKKLLQYECHSKIYMATQEESSMRFYSRLGFKVHRYVERQELGAGHFPNWFMNRG